MKKNLLKAVLVVLALKTGTPAWGQAVVFDPANFIENMLTAARTLAQIYNQIEQIENQVRVLQNMARHLKTLPFDVTAELRAALGQTTWLLEQAQGLSYELWWLDRSLERLYPDDYHGGFGAWELDAHARERWINSLESLRTTMRLQAQAAQGLDTDERVLSALVGQSQSAEGQLQATQAGNQLLALAAKQSIQTQQLQLVQGRAEAAEQARVMAEEARSRELRRRFRGSGVRYTPHPVDFYN